MLAKRRTVNSNLPRKWLHFVIIRSLLILEKGVFWLLYWIATRMENDDVFLQEDSKPPVHHVNSTPNSHVNLAMTKDRTRAASLPQVPGHGTKQQSFNPVKDFISSFVNRKGHKKRSTIKRSVTTENVGDEKAVVKYVGRGHSFGSFQLRNPTWCDCCGEFIWGLFKQCVRCKSESNLKLAYSNLLCVNRVSCFRPW